MATTGSNANPFRYGGKFGYYTDTDTGLQLAGARWYSPNAFRWTSRDPIHYRGGDNLYSYVMGNPVKYVDPSGLEPSWLVYTPDVSPDVVNFMAGVGDSLTLTLTKYGREGLGNNLVNECSTSYKFGSYIPMVIAAGRLLYASAAKALPFIVPNATSSMEGALAASRIRNSLKLLFRGGVSKRGIFTADQTIAKYGANPEAIASASSRTNAGINTWAGATVTTSAANLGSCDCQ